MNSFSTSINYDGFFTKEERQKLFQWMDLSQINYFQAFTALWICFNLFFKKVASSNRRSELEKIHDVVDSAEFRKLFIYTVEKNKEVENSILYLQQELSEKPLENLTRANQQPLSLDSKIKPKDCDLKTLFEVFYVIRCNLIHGDKSPENFRDYVLVMHSYIILKDFLEELFRFGLHPSYKAPYQNYIH